MQQPTIYRTISVDNLSIFYREAGPKQGSTILLLHGFPSSSRMFEPLFSRLSDQYHLVVPDYVGFGHSEAPPRGNFAYTFDNLASVVAHFTEAIGLSRYTIYMQDYGGPIGFRLAKAHSERVESMIIQNAVAHNEGLGEIWSARRAFWIDRKSNEDALRENLLSLVTTRTRHVGSDPRIDDMTPIFGLMNSHSLTGRARRTSNPNSSTTIVPTLPPTLCGNRGFGRIGREPSLYAGGMIRHSTSQNPRHTVAICRTLRFTFSKRDTSRWILQPTRSRCLFAISSA